MLVDARGRRRTNLSTRRKSHTRVSYWSAISRTPKSSPRPNPLLGPALGGPRTPLRPPPPRGRLAMGKKGVKKKGGAKKSGAEPDPFARPEVSDGALEVGEREVDIGHLKRELGAFQDASATLAIQNEALRSAVSRELEDAKDVNDYLTAELLAKDSEMDALLADVASREEQIRVARDTMEARVAAAVETSEAETKVLLDELALLRDQEEGVRARQAERARILDGLERVSQLLAAESHAQKSTSPTPRVDVSATRPNSARRWTSPSARPRSRSRDSPTNDSSSPRNAPSWRTNRNARPSASEPEPSSERLARTRCSPRAPRRDARRRDGGSNRRRDAREGTRFDASRDGTHRSAARDRGRAARGGARRERGRARVRRRGGGDWANATPTTRETRRARRRRKGERRHHARRRRVARTDGDAKGRCRVCRRPKPRAFRRATRNDETRAVRNRRRIARTPTRTPTRPRPLPRTTTSHGCWVGKHVDYRI